FDPDDPIGGKNSEGKRERPPFVGLSHELGHSEAFDEGTHKEDRGDKTPGTTPPIEEHAMKRETK
ncbi:hypothetical protein S1OALGB6SA_2229, partial [Olavius algarvensis spirochete endosymbiont]|uniref:hypothetical protein n=1 Tax=Olavius algarvensis spirochete endosymbiont TaxID=260710 RepID=UPI000F1BD88F